MEYKKTKPSVRWAFFRGCFIGLSVKMCANRLWSTRVSFKMQANKMANIKYLMATIKMCMSACVSSGGCAVLALHKPVSAFRRVIIILKRNALLENTRVCRWNGKGREIEKWNILNDLLRLLAYAIAHFLSITLWSTCPKTSLHCFAAFFQAEYFPGNAQSQVLTYYISLQSIYYLRCLAIYRMKSPMKIWGRHDSEGSFELTEFHWHASKSFL